MVKKADRVAKAAKRAENRQQSERAEAAMQSFLTECQTCMPSEEWQQHFAEANRSAGEALHIVEHLVFVLASTQLPISPSLRKALDAMLDSLGVDRQSCKWTELRQLNYGKYWKARYGYV